MATVEWAGLRLVSRLTRTWNGRAADVSQES